MITPLRLLATALTSVVVLFGAVTVGTPPAEAAITSECTVTITFPREISIENWYRPFDVKLGVDPRGCSDSVRMDLHSVSRKTKVGYFWIYGSQILQQKGVYSLDVPREARAGKHTIRVTDADVDNDWADRNDIAWSDTPKVFLPVKTVDIRYTTKATISLTRTIDGVKLTGTVKRYYQDQLDWGRYPNKKV